MMSGVQCIPINSDSYKARIERLREFEANIMNFIERYNTLISGPDGVFGVICDEILSLIASFLNPRDLIRPTCARLRCIYDEVLKDKYHKNINTRRIEPMPDNIVDKCVDKIFYSKRIFYYTMATNICNYTRGSGKHNVVTYTVKEGSTDIALVNETFIEVFVWPQRGSLMLIVVGDERIEVGGFGMRVLIDYATKTYTVIDSNRKPTNLDHKLINKINIHNYNQLK